MSANLPACDRILLRVALGVVPFADRSDWSRYWDAELWHRRHPRSGQACGAGDLYPGLLRDALWLRKEKHHRALSGTARLCLVLLSLSAFLAVVPLMAFTGSPRAALEFLTAHAFLFLCEGSLVTLVSLVTAARWIEHSSPADRFSQIRANLFQLAKIVLVLFVAFLLSNDLTIPFHAFHPFAAEIVQPQAFVVLALLGLRWSFGDTEGRCKHCLRTLATPTRVGRPSRNFLDSNGTELLCEAGHGLLSIPEMETSWRQSSCWIAA